MTTSNSLDNSEVFRELDTHLKTQLSLCDALEKIADQLPSQVDRQLCLHVSAQIYAVIKSAHEFEEVRLFPLMQSNQDSSEVEEILDQLHSEHWEDESYAHEVQDALFNFITQPKSVNSDTLGYMLRGFFGNLRRHIAFEKQYFSQQLAPLQASENGI